MTFPFSTLSTQNNHKMRYEKFPIFLRRASKFSVFFLGFPKRKTNIKRLLSFRVEASMESAFSGRGKCGDFQQVMLLITEFKTRNHHARLLRMARRQTRLLININFQRGGDGSLVMPLNFGSEHWEKGWRGRMESH